jgi:hypothetical protein
MLALRAAKSLFREEQLGAILFSWGLVDSGSTSAMSGHTHPRKRDSSGHPLRTLVALVHLCSLHTSLPRRHSPTNLCPTMGGTFPRFVAATEEMIEPFERWRSPLAEHSRTLASPHRQIAPPWLLPRPYTAEPGSEQRPRETASRTTQPRKILLAFHHEARGAGILSSDSLSSRQEYIIRGRRPVTAGRGHGWRVGKRFSPLIL